MAFYLDEAGLESLWDKVKDAAVKAGNCKIETGIYTGTGVYDSGNRNSLTFGFEPKLVFICPNTDTEVPYPWFYGAGGGMTTYNGGAGYCYTTWEGNTLTWYSKRSVAHQQNMSGVAYRYVAIG